MWTAASEDLEKTSEDLMTEWFGANVKGEWFPYPNKAVHIVFSFIREQL